MVTSASCVGACYQSVSRIQECKRTGEAAVLFALPMLMDWQVGSARESEIPSVHLEERV